MIGSYLSVTEYERPKYDKWIMSKKSIHDEDAADSENHRRAVSHANQVSAVLGRRRRPAAVEYQKTDRRRAGWADEESVATDAENSE